MGTFPIIQYPISIAKGGSGATTAAAAATAYGLGTGSNVQFASLGLGVAPLASVAVYHTQSAGSNVNANWLGELNGTATNRTTTSGGYNCLGLSLSSYPIVSAGQTNSQYCATFTGNAYRGFSSDTLNDSGTVTNLYGLRLNVGHVPSGASNTFSPATTYFYGIATANTIIQRGTISNYYGLYLSAQTALSAPATWVLNHAYSLNDMVKPSTGNGYYFVCTAAGTSGATEPSWTASSGGTTADGAGALVWTAIVVPTITNEWGVYSASTTGKNYFAGVTQFVAHVGIGQASATTSPLSITGLPTSNTGLAATDLWNNGGVLNIGTGGVAGALPRSFSIDAPWAWSSNVNWSSVALTTTAYAPYAQNGVTTLLTYPRVDTNMLAAGASISFNLLLDAGTWTFGTITLNSGNAGIFAVALDGVTFGTIDCYNSPGLDGVYTTFTGVAVTAGNHVLSLTCTSKNGSSSGYSGYLHKVVGVRTGA